MFKPKFLIAAIAGLLFFSKANAQTDTSYYDLGRTLLKKDFTQSITVKGTDLEKMPFDNIADAIKVWFYGAYTNKVAMVYIIDGNLVNDVNAYSIYDIDEVTLIQNALTQTSGSNHQQQLVVIKTKRSNKKGWIVEANGQANISSLYTNNIPVTNTTLNQSGTTTSTTYQTGQKSTTALYQQYDVSARGSSGGMQYGLSADYLGDALPVIKETGTTYSDPLSISRLRFNSYFDAKLGISTLDVTAGYAPQTEKDDYSVTDTYGSSTISNKQDEGIFNGSIRLTTHIIPGLTNDLHGDYNTYHLNENGSDYSTSTFSSAEDELTNSKNGNRDHDIVAYDNLRYTAKFGDWTLEPAANLSFRTFRDSTYYTNYFSANGTPDNTPASAGYYRVNQHMFLLTPSLNISYKNYFNIEGGLLYNLNLSGAFSSPSVKEKKVFPFVTASADITHLIDPSSTVAVKVYGSYAVSDHIADNFNTLQDFEPSTVQIPLLTSQNTPTAGYNGYGTEYNVYYASEIQSSSKTFFTLSGGLTVAPQKSNLVFSYFFDKRTYMGPVYVFVPFGANEVQYEVYFYSINSIQHRFSVDYKLFKSSVFSWTTGINTTMIKQSYNDDSAYKLTSPVEGSGEWTGGWVNRLNYLSFFAGLDVLYEINGKTYNSAATLETYGSYTANRVNSFSLQNLYVGYRIKTTKLKGLNVFANARNLFQNQKEVITDSRKYYGLGFDLSL